MDKKRVWTLYRVSTKEQVNKDEDIPMQRTACHRFVQNKPDWEITNELYERGISGWKKSVSQRDELQQIKEGAINKEFDILLVYYSDRLGRNKDEIPVIISFLSKNGVVVYSTEEGELRSIEHVDSLLNYIRYWQAEGESIKTSMRVKEQFKQMNEIGMFTGGNLPFGYDLVETELKHPKKDKYLNKLVINEKQADIVKIIFDLSANKGYGRHKIAAYLNERGYINHLGNKFNDKFIHRLLNNPIYIGLKRYNTNGIDSLNIKYKTQPYDDSLRIIDDETFYKAQELMRKRKLYLQEGNKQFHDSMPHSSKVLLSGLLRCKYCGQVMKTDYSYKDYERKDGTINRMICYRYRCVNAVNKTINHPKKQVGAKIIDKQAEDMIINSIRNLDLTKIDSNIEKIKNDKLIAKNNELKNLEKELQKKQKYLNVLNDEIPKSLLGESNFKPDMLNKSIEKLESEINTTIENLKLIKEDIINIEKNLVEVENEKDILYDWDNKFKNADIDGKKILLSKVIDYIIWRKDGLHIKWKLFIELSMSNQNK